MITRVLWNIIPLSLMILGAGCKDDAGIPAASGCGTKTALIGVNDGYISILCGCDESAGTIKTDGQPLTCTVPVGTWVVFDFSRNKLFHQIVPVGTPALVASGVSNPSAAEPLLSHSFQATSLATYAFKDQFQNGITGSIVTR